MKLELKHLAQYLPYELRYANTKNDKIYTMKSVSNGINMVDFGWGDAMEIKEVKPILHPLSDFEKAICKDLMIKFSTSLMIIHEIWNLIQKEKTLNQINYETYLFMCKNHVDFNNLIENNLAIDINTINQ